MNDGHARLMMLHGQANPTGLAAQVEPETVERHRNVHCDQYDQCLDKALRKRWLSWSCEHCAMFVEDSLSQATRAAHEAVSRPEVQF